MPCRRRGRTPGSGETGRPRTRGGLRTPSGESGLPAPAQRALGGPSFGSLANPSVHLDLSKASNGQGGELAPVDSNHHTQIQSLVSCRWTRGQRDGKNLHCGPVTRRGTETLRAHHSCADRVGVVRWGRTPPEEVGP